MDINKRYIITRTDIQGKTYLVARTFSRPEADRQLAELMARHEKKHDQMYRIREYELGCLADFCERERIVR